MTREFDQTKEILEEARAWGYLSKGIATRQKLLKGRRILDVGMGGGPWSLAAVNAGADFYVGVDPLVGSARVRDLRHKSGSGASEYHAFPYTPEQIMENFSNIKLIQGYLDGHLEEVIACKPQLAILDSVSEHLSDPHSVIKTTYDALDRNGIIWLAHSNYYSWVGHHGQPRDARNLDLNNPAHQALMDWRHLEPSNPVWSDKNLNRMRLTDLRDLIDKYFEIVDWAPIYDALDRLTPELREKHKQYTVEELLSATVYITGRKRDYPLTNDLSGHSFFHPPRNYGADDVRTPEEMAIAPYVNRVYFSTDGTLQSHSENNLAGNQVMNLLSPGQVIELKKETGTLKLTVSEVFTPENGVKRIKFLETLPDDVKTIDRPNWRIVLSDDLMARIMNG